MKTRVLVVMAILASAAFLSAQTTVPAPTASHTRASVAPDLSSPRAALTSFYQALQAGDIAAAKSCIFFQDARQADMFDLTMTPLWCPMTLLHTMEARFGEAGRKPFANATLQKSIEQALDMVKQVEFRVDGTTATTDDKRAAINPSAETEFTGITLKKEGDGAGQWKIVAASLGDAASDVPSGQLPMMRALRDAIQGACSATCQRLDRGDFKSAEEAYADYQSQLRGCRSEIATE